MRQLLILIFIVLATSCSTSKPPAVITGEERVAHDTLTVVVHDTVTVRTKEVVTKEGAVRIVRDTVGLPVYISWQEKDTKDVAEDVVAGSATNATEGSSQRGVIKQTPEDSKNDGRMLLFWIVVGLTSYLLFAWLWTRKN